MGLTLRTGPVRFVEEEAGDVDPGAAASLGLEGPSRHCWLCLEGLLKGKQEYAGNMPGECASGSRSHRSRGRAGGLPGRIQSLPAAQTGCIGLHCPAQAKHQPALVTVVEQCVARPGKGVRNRDS